MRENNEHNEHNVDHHKIFALKCGRNAMSLSVDRVSGTHKCWVVMLIKVAMELWKTKCYFCTCEL